MKNLYTLPTEKPSRLWLYSDGVYTLHQIPTTLFKMQHIYITSDKDIKRGDWVIYNNELQKSDGISFKSVDKKIILTTDVDLIKDGVQAIDDEFLEWFVKNPSCEEVKVKPMLSNNGRAFYGYKIITQKEEPKQEPIKEAAERLYPVNNTGSMFMPNRDELNNSYKQEGFIDGYNKAKERMYSNMQEYTEFCIRCYEKGLPYIIAEDWFEHFKNK